MRYSRPGGAGQLGAVRSRRAGLNCARRLRPGGAAKRVGPSPVGWVARTAKAIAEREARAGQPMPSADDGGRSVGCKRRPADAVLPQPGAERSAVEPAVGETAGLAVEARCVRLASACRHQCRQTVSTLKEVLSCASRACGLRTRCPWIRSGRAAGRVAAGRPNSQAGWTQLGMAVRPGADAGRTRCTAAGAVRIRPSRESPASSAEPEVALGSTILDIQASAADGPSVDPAKVLEPSERGVRRDARTAARRRSAGVG